MSSTKINLEGKPQLLGEQVMQKYLGITGRLAQEIKSGCPMETVGEGKPHRCCKESHSYSQHRHMVFKSQDKKS